MKPSVWQKRRWNLDPISPYLNSKLKTWIRYVLPSLDLLLFTWLNDNCIINRQSFYGIYPYRTSIKKLHQRMLLQPKFVRSLKELVPWVIKGKFIIYGFCRFIINLMFWIDLRQFLSHRILGKASLRQLFCHRQSLRTWLIAMKSFVLRNLWVGRHLWQETTPVVWMSRSLLRIVFDLFSSNVKKNGHIPTALTKQIDESAWKQ